MHSNFWKEKRYFPFEGQKNLVDLTLVGRPVNFAEDEDLASYFNSDSSLLPWNGVASLKMDRYDARHLLDDLSVIGKKIAKLAEAQLEDEEELDKERYMDLNDSFVQEEEISIQDERKGKGTYSSIPFSYEALSAEEEKVTVEAPIKENEDNKPPDSVFRPPFPVPEYLNNHLPATEKLHQIILKTAKFVIEKGGQAEIILRIKQGNNPNFKFLNHDHRLQPYFRFLINHPEYLEYKKETGSIKENQSIPMNSDFVTGNQHSHQSVNPISLLSAAYGEVDEDEKDDNNAITRNSEEHESGIASTNLTEYMAASNLGSEKVTETGTDYSELIKIEMSGDNRYQNKLVLPVLDKSTSVPFGVGFVDEPLPPGLDGVEGKTSSQTLINQALNDQPLTSGAGHALSSYQTNNILETSEVPHSTPSFDSVEIPPETKKIIDKIVEYVVRNGREFERVIIQRDSLDRRFPFLYPGAEYHDFYLKCLDHAFKEKRQQVPRSHTSITVNQNGVLKEDSRRKASRTVAAAADRPAFTESCISVISGSVISNHSSHTSGVESPEIVKQEYSSMPINNEIASQSKQDAQSKKFIFFCNDEKLSSEERETNMSNDSVYSAVIAVTRGIHNTVTNCNLASSLPSSFPSSSSPLSSALPSHSPSVSSFIPTSDMHASTANTEDLPSQSPVSDEEKKKAERLKKAKIFAALLKKNGSNQSSERMDPKKKEIESIARNAELAKRLVEKSSEILNKNDFGKRVRARKGSEANLSMKHDLVSESDGGSACNAKIENKDLDRMKEKRMKMVQQKGNQCDSNMSNSYHKASVYVSDDIRAKVRAMLLNI